MARHLPDRGGRAEDRAGSRAREASRAAAVRPWTRPGPQATAARTERRFPSRSSSSTCVARSVRASARGHRPVTRLHARAFGARSAAWHDGRRRARGRRGQALVDAKARFRVRAFATARRLRGRRNLFGGRAGLAGPGGRSGRPLAASPRGTQLIRVRPSALGLRAAPVWRGPKAALGRRDATRRGFTGRDGEGRTGPPPARPVKSGSSTAPPPGAEGGALSCSSSASSPRSCSRSSRSARS